VNIKFKEVPVKQTDAVNWVDVYDTERLSYTDIVDALKDAGMFTPNLAHHVEFKNKKLISELCDLKDQVTLSNHERIAPEYYDVAVSFFKATTTEYSIEAGLWLCIDEDDEQNNAKFYNGELNKTKFKWICPAIDEVSGGGIGKHQHTMYCPECLVMTKNGKCEHCGNTELKKALIIINVHSHNTFAAFWSGTDDNYHMTEYGFHMVIGHLSLPTESSLLSFTNNHKRFPVSMADLFAVEEEKKLDLVTEYKPYFKAWLKEHEKAMRWRKNEKGYNLDDWGGWYREGTGKHRNRVLKWIDRIRKIR
jgi:hypothetical protein